MDRRLPKQEAAGLPVDLFVAGCPPHPLTILDGLLRMLGRLQREGRIGPAAVTRRAT